MKTTFARLTIFFAAAFLVSTSLCGISLASDISGHGGISRYLIRTIPFDFTCMLVSFFGLLVSAIIWALSGSVPRTNSLKISPPETPEHMSPAKKDERE